MEKNIHGVKVTVEDNTLETLEEKGINVWGEIESAILKELAENPPPTD